MKSKLFLFAAFALTLNTWTMAAPAADQKGGAKSVEAKEGNSQSGKVKPYPFKTCIVSGDGLEEMDDMTVFVYKGQEIKLCCKPCKKDFDKDPAKYLKKLEGK